MSEAKLNQNPPNRGGSDHPLDPEQMTLSAHATSFPEVPDPGSTGTRFVCDGVTW